MDEEDKLPLFGVQPEDFYNTEGEGTVGDAMLGGAGLTGAAFAAQTGRAPTPAPTGPMSPLAQQVAANDVANRAARTTQPQLIGQGTLSGPGRPVPGTQLSPIGTQVPATTGAGAQITPSAPRPVPSTIQTRTGQIVPGELSAGPMGQGPASKITSGLLKGTIGLPSLALAPTGLGDATISGAIDRRIAEYKAQGRDDVDAFIMAQNDFSSMRPTESQEAPAAPALAEPAAITPLTSRVDELIQAGAMTPEGEMTAIGEEMSASNRTPAEQAQMNFQERISSDEPLNEQEIADARYYAASMGMGFDPSTGYTRGGAMDTGVARTQAELQRQFGGSTISEILRQPEFGLRTDPEGRMIPAGFQTRAEAYPVYERDAAARDAGIAARPDFMEARPSAARQAGVMSMADARKLSGGDRDVAKRMIKLQEMGRDPLTGKLMDTPEEKAAELAGAKARTEYYNTLVGKAKKEDPDKLSLIEGYADRLGLTGEPRQTFIFGQLGGADIGDILGSDINSIPNVSSQEEYDALPSGSQYYDSAGKLATKK